MNSEWIQTQVRKINNPLTSTVSAPNKHLLKTEAASNYLAILLVFTVLCYVWHSQTPIYTAPISRQQDQLANHQKATSQRDLHLELYYILLYITN